MVNDTLNPVKTAAGGMMQRLDGMASGPRTGRFSWLAAGLIMAAVVCGIATYATLTTTGDFSRHSSTVIWLLDADLVVLAALLALLVRRIVSLFSGRRRGAAASRLHVRLVMIFCLLAAAPAILMTIFSALFLHIGVENWFDQRVRTAVFESQAVAEAYLEEHKQIIRADTLAMASDLDRNAPLLIEDGEALSRLVNTQSLLRNLSEAEMISGDGKILAQSNLTLALSLDNPPDDAMEQAQRGNVALMTGGGGGDRVRALVRLNNYPDTYLYVGRMVDPKVLAHVMDTRKASEAYHTLESQRSQLQVKITLIYIVIALLLMLIATWFGLQFARQLVLPIGALIDAADQVRAGDLTARVPELPRGDEFDNLGRAFNRMTSQIQQQRDELVAANRQMDERRHFTETVLAGVSAGIVGVADDGRITLANNSASLLLGQASQSLTESNIFDILPEVRTLLAQAQQRPSRVAQAEMPWSAGDSRRVFLVRIAVEDDNGSAVLTFDDITELQSAQRKAAWADVARRIAHEIKNPLTPIQLSAERLRRRYMKQITEDREIFVKCTDTIIHHVGDIGRMVNEFSAFARMPEPVMQREDIAGLMRDMLVMRQQAHGDIDFNIHGGDRALFAQLDAQQFRQAFTNIVQNAVDAIQADPARAEKGRIDIRVVHRPDHTIVLAVSDNGAGLPRGEDPDRLTEPYVTHKEKGTGLGLAIVKKIMGDHKGRLVIGTPDWLKAEKDWNDPAGATICLVFPEDRAASPLEGLEAVA